MWPWEDWNVKDARKYARQNDVKQPTIWKGADGKKWASVANKNDGGNVKVFKPSQYKTTAVENTLNSLTPKMGKATDKMEGYVNDAPGEKDAPVLVNALAKGMVNATPMGALANAGAMIKSKGETNMYGEKPTAIEKGATGLNLITFGLTTFFGMSAKGLETTSVIVDFGAAGIDETKKYLEEKKEEKSQEE